jgi:hypothetical protein
MWHLHVCQNSLWFDECWSYFSKGHGHSILRGKDKFVVIYLDDIIVFSKSDPDHLQHLRKVFLKCIKFGISLNPKKSHFVMEEGKLIGHIISKTSIKIDPDRVATI